MQIIATQSKAKPKIFAKSDYQALWPVDAKYATRPSPLSVEHSQIVALFWNLRFCAPPPIKSGQGPKSPSVVKVAPPLGGISSGICQLHQCSQCLFIKYLETTKCPPDILPNPPSEYSPFNQNQTKLPSSNGIP